MKSGIYFMHYRTYNRAGDTIQPQGGATVAIRKVGDDKLVIAIARCARNDIFNKKLGREISEGRLDAYLGGKVLTEDKVRDISLAKYTEFDAVKDIVNREIGEEMIEFGLY